MLAFLEGSSKIGLREGPILSPPTISFELHATIAKEIDLQFSELKKLCDLDLGSG